MNAIEFHRAAVAYHASELARLEGTPGSSGFDQNRVETWWPAMLEQFKNDGLPHAWRDPGFGVPITETGDNDPVDEALLRAFKPFMDAATREGIEDSAGVRFYLPTIKKRAGIGPQASGVIRDEIKRAWESQWGRDWRADELNIAAGHVPPDGEVARLFAKVYG